MDAEDGSSVTDEPTDEEVVQTAVDAAEDVIFSRFRTSEIDDLDVNVSFEDGILEVDIYLNTGDEAEDELVADAAARAAQDAVDDLFYE